MVYEFLQSLEKEVGKDNLKDILNMADQDIKFNRVGFKKITGSKQFINICNGCKGVVLRGVK